MGGRPGGRPGFSETKTNSAQAGAGARAELGIRKQLRLCPNMRVAGNPPPPPPSDVCNRIILYTSFHIEVRLVARC